MTVLVHCMYLCVLLVCCCVLLRGVCLWCCFRACVLFDVLVCLECALLCDVVWLCLCVPFKVRSCDCGSCVCDVCEMFCVRLCVVLCVVCVWLMGLTCVVSVIYCNVVWYVCFVCVCFWVWLCSCLFVCLICLSVFFEAQCVMLHGLCIGGVLLCVLMCLCDLRVVLLYDVVWFVCCVLCVLHGVRWCVV